MNWKNISLVLFIVLATHFSCKKDKEKVSERTSNPPIMYELEDNRSLEKEEKQFSRTITYNDLISLDDKSRNILFCAPENFKYMLPYELRLLRNEIFARQGYIFKNSELKSYFESKSWYTPKYESVDSISLNETFKKILDSIIKYEQINKQLKITDLKKQFKKIISTYPKSSTVPTALFNRFMPESLCRDLSQPIQSYSQELKIVDTLSTGDKIIIGFFVSMCPAEYCEYTGDYIVCDTNMDFIDHSFIHGLNLQEYFSNDTLYIEYYEYYGSESILDNKVIDKNGLFVE